MGELESPESIFPYYHQHPRNFFRSVESPALVVLDNRGKEDIAIQFIVFEKPFLQLLHNSQPYIPMHSSKERIIKNKL